MRCCAPFAIGGAILLACSGAASAADVPGNRNTNRTLRVTNDAPTIRTERFEFLGDRDWFKVRLEGGRNYVFAAAPGLCNGLDPDRTGDVILNLRNASGRLVRSGARTDCFPEDDGALFAGFEFRPSKTATFFLEYGQEGRTAPIPFPYRVIAARDCPEGTRTICQIALNQTRQGFLAYQGDRDSYRTSLTVGRQYTVAIADPLGGDGRLIAFFTDAAGTIVSNSNTFTPTVSGTYFVTVGTDNDGGSFDFTVTLR
jgi:hypothetical protein